MIDVRVVPPFEASRLGDLSVSAFKRDLAGVLTCPGAHGQSRFLSDDHNAQRSIAKEQVKSLPDMAHHALAVVIAQCD
jgi:hypothetical protein